MQSTISWTLRPANKDLTRTWYIEYSVPGKGKQKKYGQLNKISTIAERMKEVDRLVAGLKQVPIPQADPVEKTKNDLIKQLQRVIDGKDIYCREKTMQTYQSKFNMFVTWWRDKKNEKSISELGLGLAYMKYLKNKGCNSTTINNAREYLKSFFKEVDKVNNPFENTRKLPEYRVSARYFSTKLQNHLCREITLTNPQLWLACQFQYYLLLRPGELRQIRIGSFDFERQLLKVEGNISKNKKTMYVRIPDDLVATLEFLKDYPAQYFVFGTGGKPDKIARNKKYFPDEHQKILARLRLNTTEYKFYSWKHTGACMYYLATKDLKGLKEQGRWHSLSMVEEYLKNLGILDMVEVKTKYPMIGDNCVSI